MCTFMSALHSCRRVSSAVGDTQLQSADPRARNMCADVDGSIVRQVRPDKPAGPYLIGSFPDWWRLDNAECWWEVRAPGVSKQ